MDVVLGRGRERPAPLRFEASLEWRFPIAFVVSIFILEDLIERDGENQVDIRVILEGLKR